MKYSPDSIQVISDLELICQRPQMFLPRVSGGELAKRIVGEASLLSDRPATLLRSESWWIIASEDDWLAHPAGVSIDQLFARVIPFPEAGPNSMRAEVLLTAFASDIVTLCPTETRIIKGPVAVDEVIWQAMKSRPEWRRVLAFRLGEEKEP